jgi:hypothetical protein
LAIILSQIKAWKQPFIWINNCFHNAELAQKMKSKCFKLFFSRS